MTEESPFNLLSIILLIAMVLSFPERTINGLGVQTFMFSIKIYLCSFVSVYVCVPHARRGPSRSEEGIKSLGAEVTRSCELPGGC